MNWVQPVVLEKNGIRLEPLGMQHVEGLAQATQDGELWTLTVTSAPEPDKAADYIQTALNTPDRFAFAVIDIASGDALGTSSYHDILPLVRRLEIGYTWYRKSTWRSAVNTTCKLMLMQHAFETLEAKVVGWRTDNLNFRSQTAIERLGAKKDGTLRGHALRRDGSIRDTVMYSMTQSEWPEAQARLEAKLAQWLPESAQQPATDSNA